MTSSPFVRSVVESTTAIDRADQACDHQQAATALPAKSTVVVDAERHPREEVVALVETVGLVDERLPEALLDGGHDVTAAESTGSVASPSRCSSAARPRWRCVLTELREIPIASAMSSIPSSS